MGRFRYYSFMSEDLSCYRCGASLAALTMPIARQDECPNCLVHVHVCRMCVFYDPQVTKQCREDDAEEVREKERANFCDYFKPRGDAFSGEELAAETQAKEGLATLFADSDGDESPSDSAPDAAKDLFK
jgi:hypothetical protein